MAKAKFWQKGESIDYVNGTGSKIDANTIILYGSRLAVAGCDIAAGEKGSLYVSGVFEMPKDYGDSGKALTAGQEVYWDNSNSVIKAAVAQVVAEGLVTTEASAVNGFVNSTALVFIAEPPEIAYSAPVERGPGTGQKAIFYYILTLRKSKQYRVNL